MGGLAAVMQSSVTCNLQGAPSPEQRCPARASRLKCSTNITSVRLAAVHHQLQEGLEPLASKEALCRYRCGASGKRTRPFESGSAAWG